MKLKQMSIAAKMLVSIILFQLITLYLAIAYFTYDLLIVNRTNYPGYISDSQLEFIIDSVGYNESHTLNLKAGTEIADILKNPDAWLVVADDKGQLIKKGNIPPEYNFLTENIRFLGLSEIKINESLSHYAMKAMSGKAEGNNIYVMLGGTPVYHGVWDFFLSLVKELSLKMFIPMGIAALIIMPLVTRRILAGISDAAYDAQHIHEGDHKARLRESGIPHEILPLVKAVNAALQRLSEGYEERDRFLASAAHELRAPLAVIEARLQIIEDHNVRQILSNDVARLSNLAESLLDLQRLGQSTSFFTLIDIKRFMRKVVSDYSPMIIAAGYDIELIVCNEPVFIYGDDASLSRAVINILQNAVHHGGGKGLITVEVTHSGCITVQDCGPGIPADEREKIFEPFHRLHLNSQGTGLGLHLVKHIIELHQGEIRAKEGKNGGSIFEIRIPLLKAFQLNQCNEQKR
ncbi:sensor histidine kinase [Cronobacter sakazakii]